MKNIKRKLIVILAFGLVLSISTPVFATETEEQKDTTNPVATPLEETAKDNVTEEQKRIIDGTCKCSNCQNGTFI
ncbi:hypothetical protein [Listeria seeligeri]|uniref:hypothetical protein n=1 Tax=Listeria seeligeri TaxID=1640 RepID=UPI0021AB5271|nr:hypothetical protein [Listeria seeligeri]